MRFFEACTVLLIIGAGVLLAEESRQELVFPLVVSGFLGDAGFSPHFEMTFIFENRSASTVSASLQIFRNNGEEIQIGPPTFPFTITGSKGLPVNSLTSLSLFHASLIPPVIPPRVSGWAKLGFSDSSGLEPEAELVFFDSPAAPSTTVHFKPIQPRNEFRIALVDRPDRQFGIAIANPSADKAATVNLALKVEPGFRQFPNCPTSIVIPARNSLSRFLEDFCGQQDTSTRKFPPPSGGSQSGVTPQSLSRRCSFTKTEALAV